MISLAFGQSNAANNGQKAYTTHYTFVFNYYNGKLYAAKDSMLGSTGKGESLRTRLGDKLIDIGFYKKVILIPIAVGGTAIERWANGGDCFEKL